MRRPALGTQRRTPNNIMALFLLGTAALACSPVSPEKLHVAAAASLAPAFTELSRLYEEETGDRILLTFSSTGALSEQIRNGAPFDLFASADREHIDQLVAEGYLLPESKTLFAFGSLILLIRPEFQGKIMGLSDLQITDVRRIAIANPEIAPYGKAARQILRDAGLWETLASKIVLSETVHQAYVFITSGNADAGIVARSVLPEGLDHYPYIRLVSGETPEHWAAILRRSDIIPRAESFLAFLQSQTARDVLERFGFQPPAIDP